MLNLAKIGVVFFLLVFGLLSIYSQNDTMFLTVKIILLSIYIFGAVHWFSTNYKNFKINSKFQEFKKLNQKERERLIEVKSKDV